VKKTDSNGYLAQELMGMCFGLDRVPKIVDSIPQPRRLSYPGHPRRMELPKHGGGTFTGVGELDTMGSFGIVEYLGSSNGFARLYKNGILIHQAEMPISTPQ